MPPDERKMLLLRAIQTQITPTMRIESQSDFQTVLVFTTEPNHILHFLIGVVTMGAWWLVWLVIAIKHKPLRRMVTVMEDGRIESRDYQ